MKNLENIVQQLSLGVDFDEELHKYTYQGKALISCTQLLELMGITKSFKEIENLPEVHKARSKGVRIHEEVNHYLTCIGEGNEWCLDIPTNPLIHTPETKLFLEWFKKQETFPPLLSEQIVFNREYQIAGRFDMGWYNMGQETYIIGDIKTAKQVDLWPAAWQLALYRYMISQSTDTFKNFKLLVFSFDFDANTEKASLKVDDVSNYVSQTDVLNMLKAYSLGEKYEATSIIISEGQKELLLTAANMLEEIAAKDKAIKDLKLKLGSIKSVLYDVMSKRDVSSVKIKVSDSKEITVKRSDKFFRKSLDVQKLKETEPSIYKAFCRLSEVDPTVRISVKEVNDEEDSITSAVSRI